MRCTQGRQIVEVQFEPGEVYNAWYTQLPLHHLLVAEPMMRRRYPTVTRVKRTVYTRPKQRTIERHIYW